MHKKSSDISIHVDIITQSGGIHPRFSAVFALSGDLKQILSAFVLYLNFVTLALGITCDVFERSLSVYHDFIVVLFTGIGQDSPLASTILHLRMN